MQMFVNSVRSQGTTIDAFGSSLARLTYLIRLLVMKMVLSIRPWLRPQGQKTIFRRRPQGPGAKITKVGSVSPALQLGKSMLPWRGGGTNVTAPRVQRGHFVTPVSLPEQVQGSPSCDAGTEQIPPLLKIIHWQICTAAIVGRNFKLDRSAPVDFGAVPPNDKIDSASTSCA